MDLRRWAHIVAVADRRSFVRAAEQVHLTQPALTRSIQAAEVELGFALFDRRSNEVVATPAGDFVVARARQLVFDGRCLERDIDLYRNNALGDLAFGVGPYPAATFLGPLLAEVHGACPGVDVRVDVGNWQLLVERLLAESIEFFVADVRDLPADPRLLVRPLRREPGGFFVRSAHPLGRKAATLRQVWTCGVASVRAPLAVRAALARLLGLDGADAVSIALECDDVQLLKTAALHSDLVLAAPHAAVADETAKGSLRRLSVEGLPPLYSEMGVITLRGRTPSPMAVRVIGMLPSERPPSAAARSKNARDRAVSP